MKLLLTGGSSFTGCWFARALTEAGHQVTATLTRPSIEAYHDGVRAQRVADLAERCEIVTGCRFGDDRFIEVIRNGDFDVVCHHGAEATAYKSPDFDVAAALASNTHRLREVLATMTEAGTQRMLLTGSVFEGGEGAGSEGLPHFSPYGLGKALTAEAFAFYCRDAQIHLGKFVIPNPFGPLEEPRFTAYLMRNWFAGQTPSVNTPMYVRDNIHVDLLAQCYVRFAEGLPDEPGYCHLSPGGYIESQGAFAQRFADAMSERLELACDLELNDQVEFPEPRIRVGTDPAVAIVEDWDEQAAWDAVAKYYRALHTAAAQ